MGVQRYSRASDNVALDATWSVTGGSEDPDYPAENLSNPAIDVPAQLTTTSGIFLGTLADTTPIACVSLLMHNFDDDLTVRFQAHSSNSWGAPTINSLFTIGPRRADDFPPGEWLDLTVADVPVSGMNFVRLNVVDSNGSPVKVGGIFIGSALRDFQPDTALLPGLKEGERRSGLIQRSHAGGRIAIDFGLVWRRYDYSAVSKPDGLDDMRNLWRSALGTNLGWLFIPDEDVNESALVHFDEGMGPNPEFLALDVTTYSLQFEEEDRGLPL